MKIISFPPIYTQNRNVPSNNAIRYSGLAPLRCDTVSFGALKKNFFQGIDFVIVERFKAPIEKFNSNNDLQSWAKKQINEIMNKDFDGRQEETSLRRKVMLKEWADYVLNENDAYNDATALLILSCVVKDLKPDNDKLPPVLNKRVLADCVSEINTKTMSDKNYRFDFNKMYETKLRAFYLEDTNTVENETKWVVIPSKKHDSENFEQSVEKLKTLSHKNWCTKSFNADPYLSEGDFHIYLENGKPKLGVRFRGDKINEIEGEKNDGSIPVEYLDILQSHINKNNLMLSSDSKNQIHTAIKQKKEIDKIKTHLNNAIKNNDIKAILEYFGNNILSEKDGKLILKNYQSSFNINGELYNYSLFGINENDLFKNVELIEGNAYFNYSSLKSLGNLTYIGGNARFVGAEITDLGNLKSVGGFLDLSYSDVKSLGNLETVGGSVNFKDSLVTDTGKLKTVGGNVSLSFSKLTSLGELEEICGSLESTGTSDLISLGNLRSIGKNAIFCKSKLKNLGKLEYIGNDADFAGSEIESLSNLEYIGGTVDFCRSKVSDLGKLKTVGEILYNDGYNECSCKLNEEDFKNIQIIGTEE